MRSRTYKVYLPVFSESLCELQNGTTFSMRSTIVKLSLPCTRVANFNEYCCPIFFSCLAKPSKLCSDIDCSG